MSKTKTVKQYPCKKKKKKCQSRLGGCLKSSSTLLIFSSARAELTVGPEALCDQSSIARLIPLFPYNVV